MKRSGVSVTMVLLLFTLNCADTAGAGDEWRVASLGMSGAITAVRARSGTCQIYASSEKGLFVSADGGASWRPVEVPGTGGYVTLLDVGEKTAGVISSGCVYIAGLERAEWRLVSASGAIKGGSIIRSGGAEEMIFWDDRRFYRENKGALEVAGGLPGNKVIGAAVCSGGKIFAMSSGALYVSDSMGAGWEKIYAMVSDAYDTEEIPEDISEGPELISSAARMNASYDGTVTAVTDRGIIVAGIDGRGIRIISTEGLPAAAVIRAAAAGGDIYAATSGRVYELKQSALSWDTVLEVASSGSISDMDRYVDGSGKAGLVVSTASRIYSSVTEEPGSARGGRADFPARGIPAGPDIREVHRMAIEYAEVSPEKIIGWRRGARWKAVMPRLSLNFSESTDDNIDIYKSSSNYYVINGPREKGNDWSVGLTWDLSDLVWNSEQTNIDVRSKLMVQLREDILEEVTRLYFERKKVFEEIGGLDDDSKARREKCLRAEELTAYIDALTGGQFSRSINTEVNPKFQYPNSKQISINKGQNI